MKAWKVILVAVVLFVAGAAAGAATVQLLQKQRPPARSQPNSLPWQAQRGAFLRLLERELNLTREQREDARRLLEESRDRTNRELRRETQRVREEMNQILTPDQRRRLQEIQRNRANRRSEASPREDLRHPDPRRFRNQTSPNEAEPGQPPADTPKHPDPNP